MSSKTEERSGARYVDQGLQSVDRAVTLLQMLAGSGPARVTDLAADLGVHKSTVSRLMSTLERRGLVDRVDGGGKFRVGPGLAALAASAARPRSLVEVARPVMNDLAIEIGESISINVLTEDLDLLTVDQAVGPSAVTGFNWLGQHSPAHATAAGKVLIATLEPDRLERFLNRELDRFTDATMLGEKLRDEVQRVADLGVASCRDELELGLSAVAAPIVHPEQKVRAALSVAGPTSRIVGSSYDQIVRAVRESADEILVRLGGLPRT